MNRKFFLPLLFIITFVLMSCNNRSLISTTLKSTGIKTLSPTIQHEVWDGFDWYNVRNAKLDDIVKGMKVINVYKDGGVITGVDLKGQVEVSGTYELFDEITDDSGCWFTLDKESMGKIPYLFEDIGERKEEYRTTFSISNYEQAKEILKYEKGNAKIIIDNYYIGHTQITESAKIISCEWQEEIK